MLAVCAPIDAAQVYEALSELQKSSRAIPLTQPSPQTGAQERAWGEGFSYKQEDERESRFHSAFHFYIYYLNQKSQSPRALFWVRVG
jgi:hypothetical protein